MLRLSHREIFISERLIKISREVFNFFLEEKQLVVRKPP